MKKLLGILLALSIMMGMMCILPAAMASSAAACFTITPSGSMYYPEGLIGAGKFFNPGTTSDKNTFYYPDDGLLALGWNNSVKPLKIEINLVEKDTIPSPGVGGTSPFYYYPIKAGTSVSFANFAENAGEFVLSIVASENNAITVTCSPESYAAGQCPSDFRVLIGSDFGAVGLIYSDITSACYYINEVEIPIMIDDTGDAIRIVNKDGRVGLRVTETGAAKMSALSAGKYQIWMDYDNSKSFNLLGRDCYIMTHLCADFTVTNSGTTAVPATGDSTPVATYAVLAACALLCAAALLVWKKRSV